MQMVTDLPVSIVVMVPKTMKMSSACLPERMSPVVKNAMLTLADEESSTNVGGLCTQDPHHHISG